MKIFKKIVLMLVVMSMMVMLCNSVFAQERQVYTDNDTIEAIISQPWISLKNGTVILTFGDAFLRHFKSQDWRVTTDKYGQEMVSFYGDLMTGMGYTVSVEFYFKSDPENPRLLYFNMGNQKQSTQMGLQLIKTEYNEDLQSYARGELR